MKKEWDCEEEEEDDEGWGCVYDELGGFAYLAGWLARALSFWHCTNTGYMCISVGFEALRVAMGRGNLYDIEGGMAGFFPLSSRPARPCDEQMTGVQRLGQCEKR
jgi:hypothetical protein